VPFSLYFSCLVRKKGYLLSLGRKENKNGTQVSVCIGDFAYYRCWNET